MFNNKRVCIFVDGENLRHSIVELFPSFDKRTYLPRADWTRFFDWIASEVAGQDAYRVRSYWYVVQNIDFSPYNLSAARKNQRNLETILLRDSGIGGDLSRTVSQEERNKLIEKIADALEKTQRDMEKRFAGWTSLQDVIAHDHTAVEFRRAGAIRYDLFNMALGSEKAVDVKLATDLIKLKDIYDIAVIVSGDQDYVPAVDAIKDFGKHTVNVSFQTENGRLLPGGARRLNQSTDRILKVKHSVLQTYLNLKEVISETREEA